MSVENSETLNKLLIKDFKSIIFYEFLQKQKISADFLKILGNILV